MFIDNQYMTRVKLVDGGDLAHIPRSPEMLGYDLQRLAASIAPPG